MKGTGKGNPGSSGCYSKPIAPLGAALTSRMGGQVTGSPSGVNVASMLTKMRSRKTFSRGLKGLKGGIKKQLRGGAGNDAS